MVSWQGYCLIVHDVGYHTPASMRNPPKKDKNLIVTDQIK